MWTLYVKCRRHSCPILKCTAQIPHYTKHACLFLGALSDIDMIAAMADSSRLHIGCESWLLCMSALLVFKHMYSGDQPTLGNVCNFSTSFRLVHY